MDQEKLIETLRRVEHELSRIQTTDPESRRVLEEARDEIQTALAEGSQPEPEGLLEKLREAAGRFERSHPGFSYAVAELTDTLGRMGL